MQCCAICVMDNRSTIVGSMPSVNQSNTLEKNQQVPCMAWIYRLALLVLVWLGEDDGTARIGLKLVQGLAMVSERPGFANNSTATMSLGLAMRGQPEQSTAPCARPTFPSALVWVTPDLEEVALAREPIFCCGRYQLPWDKFRAGMESISNSQSGNLLF